VKAWVIFYKGALNIENVSIYIVTKLYYFGFSIQTLLFAVPDHDGGRPMEVNACILTTHMVYL
jgi:hypothetical protein